MASHPAMTLRSIALSVTLRVIGPQVSKVRPRGMIPAMGTRPIVGLIPTVPQAEEGILTEPPVSVPSVASAVAFAIAAAEPPLQPPQNLFRSHGFRLGP